LAVNIKPWLQRSEWLSSVLVACAVLATVSARTEEPAATDQVAPAGQAAPSRAFQSSEVAEFDRLRGGKDVVVLDVRTPKEFAAGHLPGAVNLDWTSPDFAKRAGALARDKTYLVYCATGRRSALACDKMSQLKFKQLHNLSGGFRAWQSAGKPVER
jgi:rhodanese-related sulfurtransferase